MSEADPADAEACIDTTFHREELEFLTEVGCVPQPTLRHDPPEERWLREYKDEMKAHFIKSAKGARPLPDKLEVEGAPPPLAPPAICQVSVHAPR